MLALLLLALRLLCSAFLRSAPADAAWASGQPVWTIPALSAPASARVAASAPAGAAAYCAYTPTKCTHYVGLLYCQYHGNLTSLFANRSISFCPFEAQNLCHLFANGRFTPVIKSGAATAAAGGGGGGGNQTAALDTLDPGSAPTLDTAPGPPSLDPTSVLDPVPEEAQRIQDPEACSGEHSNSVFLPNFTVAKLVRCATDMLGAANVEPSVFVMVGDSLMRQLFSTLMHIVRGSTFFLDYSVQAHAVYTLCPGNDRVTVGDPLFDIHRSHEPLHHNITQTALASLLYRYPKMVSCPRPSLTVLYIHAPLYRTQGVVLKHFRQLEEDERAAGCSGAKPGLLRTFMCRNKTYILNFGIWERNKPSKHTKHSMVMYALAKIRDARANLVVLNTPTKYTGTDARKFMVRNKWLGEWARKEMKLHLNMMFVDFEKVSWMNESAVVVSDGVHYQCALKSFPRVSAPMNGRTFGYIALNTAWDCVDRMNMLIWSRILDSLCREGEVPAPEDEDQ